MKKRTFLLLFLACLLGQARAQQKKLALIVGNSTYENGALLANPLNDVMAMDAVLQQLGFVTMRYENVGLNELKKAIDQFGKQLQQYDVGLFYYAGHGLQHKGMNYLVPVDADLHMPQLVEFDCVPVDRVLAFMEHSNTSVNLIILDACRNNPFERSWYRTTEGNGLAFMNAPSGSLIAYATAPGSVASDGVGKNGLYTSMLLKHMVIPNLTVEQVFKRVRAEIEEVSRKKQIPWESTSLKGDFYFNPDSLLTAQMQSEEDERKQNITREIQHTRRHTVRMQVEVPVQFGIGYGLNLSRNIVLDVQAGRMGQPNSVMMLNMMGSFGNDKLTLMIRNAFTSGNVYEAGFSYHFRNYYVGAFAQGIFMKGAVATSHVEQNFDTDVSLLPVKEGRTDETPQSVDIASDLIQGGLMFGRIVHLKNHNWQVRLEFALSKNFASSSTIYSADRDLSTLQAEVDSQLDQWYHRFGYVPSLSIGMAHTFGKTLK